MKEKLKLLEKEKDTVVVDVKTCEDCQKEFDFYEGERDFYKEKGWAEPKRCPTCREKNKKENLDMSNKIEYIIKQWIKRGKITGVTFVEKMEVK